MRRPGWGRARLFPVSAIVVGLVGGFGVGRAMRPATDVDVAPHVAPIAIHAEDPAPEKIAVKDEPKVVEAAMAVPPAEKKPVAEIAPTSPEKHPAAVKPQAARSVTHVRSTPPGAQVARAADGEALGTTPFDLDLPESDKPVALLFWKKGFAVKEEKIIPRGELGLTVDLNPKPIAAATPKPKKKGSKHLSSTTTIDPFN